MKKKIIVLVLVFGLASAANAGLFFTVGGEDPGAITRDPLANPTITLEISGDGQTAAPARAYLLVEGLGGIDGGAVLYTGDKSEYLDCDAIAGDMGLPDCDAVLAAYKDFLGMPGLTDTAYAVFAGSEIPLPPLDGILVDSIVFTCLGQPGYVNVTLLAEDFVTVLDSLVIEQVPEPITFALLGLGGLFLRRRK